MLRIDRHAVLPQAAVQCAAVLTAPQHLAALEQAGALEHLEDGSVVLRDIGLYTQTTGLTLEPSGGNALFIG